MSLVCVLCGRPLPRRAVEAGDPYCSRGCAELAILGRTKALTDRQISARLSARLKDRKAESEERPWEGS